MRRFHVAVVFLLGVVVCVQAAVLFLLLDQRDAPPAWKIATAPAIPVPVPVPPVPASPPAPSPPSGVPDVPVSEPSGEARPRVLEKKFEPLSLSAQKTPDGTPFALSGVLVPKPVDAVRLQALQKKFESLSAQKEPDIGEVDVLLGELMEIQGTSVIAGVDLNVVRQNLHIARDLQQIAREMDAEYRKPAPDAAKMEDLQERAVTLQNRLAASLQGLPAGNAPLPGSGR